MPEPESEHQVRMTVDVGASAVDATREAFVDVLRRERENLLEKRRHIDECVASIERLLMLERQDVVRSASATGRRGGERNRSPYTGEEIGRIVQEVIVEAGRPLRTGEILDRLDARGVPIVGKNRKVVLNTIMRRRRREDGSPAILGIVDGNWPAGLPLPDGSWPEPRTAASPRGPRGRTDDRT